MLVILPLVGRSAGQGDRALLKRIFPNRLNSSPPDNLQKYNMGCPFSQHSSLCFLPEVPATICAAL